MLTTLPKKILPENPKEMREKHEKIGQLHFFLRNFFNQNVHPDTWNVPATDLLKHFRLKSKKLQPGSKSDKNLKLYQKNVYL